MMASGEGVWPEKGYVPGKDRGGVLMGQCQLARGAWVGSSHLDTFVDLSLQEVFIFSSWVSAVSCSITALEPCGLRVTLVILKTPSGLLQSP